MDGIVSEHLLRISEVARRLGISKRTVWRRIAAGELPEPVRSGRVTWLAESDLNSYIERLKRGRAR